MSPENAPELKPIDPEEEERNLRMLKDVEGSIKDDKTYMEEISRVETSSNEKEAQRVLEDVLASHAQEKKAEDANKKYQETLEKVRAPKGESVEVGGGYTGPGFSGERPKVEFSAKPEETSKKGVMDRLKGWLG